MQESGKRWREMADKKGIDNDRIEELLAKLLTVSLWSTGANQNTIARAVGKSTVWVNTLLKGVPKSK
jgi:hypothetical protein